MKGQLVAVTTGVAIVLISGILATSVTFVAEQKAYAQGSSGSSGTTAGTGGSGSGGTTALNGNGAGGNSVGAGAAP